ncbi:MAG: dihydrodipicolinate synthase family protein, partial [Lachnospiraceae bacterium]|nr:dihydrodipicolinate synthase family protein [Lachnospiraceae bacterium]
ITPSVTALDKSGHVDLEANSRLYENLITNGMDGILILGSIGEFFAIPMEEKKALVENAVKTVAGRVELLVGTNCMVQSECIEFSNYALEQGADAVMVVAPYYFNIPDSGVEYFFDTIAKKIKGDMYLYNFPARTGYALKPEMIKQLVANNKNIVGIKDTVPNMDSTRSIIQKVKREYPNFKVYSGFDEFFGHNLLSGGDGCITGISNFAPGVAAGYADAARRDDLAAMQVYQQKIDSMMSIYEIGEQFVPIIKKAIQLTGIQIEDRCTEPLQSATDEETEAIRRMLKQNGVI